MCNLAVKYSLKIEFTSSAADVKRSNAIGFWGAFIFSCDSSPPHTAFIKTSDARVYLILTAAGDHLLFAESNGAATVGHRFPPMIRFVRQFSYKAI
jgi:hypothetical protein